MVWRNAKCGMQRTAIVVIAHFTEHRGNGETGRKKCVGPGRVLECHFAKLYLLGCDFFFLLFFFLFYHTAPAEQRYGDVPWQNEKESWDYSRSQIVYALDTTRNESNCLRAAKLELDKRD